VGVVEESVTDGISQGRVGEVVMPLGRRELAGDDGGAGAIAILEDLQEVAALLILHGGEGEVVDHQDVEARELGEQAEVGAVGSGQSQLMKSRKARR
jgi:hypothetical protein